MLKGESRGKYIGVVCKEPGCYSNAKVKGYCVNCYNRIKYQRRVGKSGV